VLAVALESVVKIAALAAVGALALVLIFGTPVGQAPLPDIRAAAPLTQPGFDFRFLVLTLLAGLAALTLPRQFHMMVAEARDPADARASRWIFPAYLLVVAVLAPPIALAGLQTLSAANPDSYVIALPLSAGSESLALLAFIGGFSAAAGMVTVAALAMSTMLVNDIAAPLIIRGRGLEGEGGLAASLLTWRRIAVVALVAAAYAFQLGLEPEAPLASLGLVAFAGAAQLGPALLFGLFWRRANRAGALSGLSVGLALWAALILIPSYTGWQPPAPQGVDPFAVFSLVSLVANALAFIIAVAFFGGGLVDQLQADAFTGKGGAAGPASSSARVADVEAVLVRVLGEDETAAAMDALAAELGRALRASDAATPALIALAEARLARSVGAASSRILMTRVIAGSRVSAGDVVALIDETAGKLRTSEDRLEESERSIRFYTDNLPALLSYADRSYRLRFANRGYLDFFGLDESAIGRPLAEFMSEDEHALRRPYMEAALNGERQIFDISRKMAGRKRSWQVVYQPRIEDGEVVGFFGVYQDNTARRQAEEGLKRAYDQMERRVDERTAELRAESEARGRLAEDLDRARAEAEAATRSKTRFLAAASHDLLQPLSAARLFAGALEDSLKGKAGDEAETARRIERSIEQADRLLRALLDISRLDAGGVTPAPSVFSLGQLMEETAAPFTAKAEAKGLKLVIMPTRLAVFSDRGLMTSVLQNLISNAVRYTEGGAVLVGARRRGREVFLQVIDTGPGVPEDKRRSIFREFDRGGRKDDGDRGLGLGLAVTDRICKTLGHRLTLSSQEGRGSCFEVRLPRASAKPVAPKPPRRSRSAALDGLKVLCLEDEADVRDAMIALMTRWGCDARGAADRTGAETAFDGDAPDVVLLDYQLGGDDTGPQAYGALCKAWRRAPPAVLITAERGHEVADIAAEAGLEVLQKPAAPAVLRATLDALRRKAVG
jgi:PAS domain S-box-containing protein